VPEPLFAWGSKVSDGPRQQRRGALPNYCGICEFLAVVCHYTKETEQLEKSYETTW